MKLRNEGNWRSSVTKERLFKMRNLSMFKWVIGGAHKEGKIRDGFEITGTCLDLPLYIPTSQ